MIVNEALTQDKTRPRLFAQARHLLKDELIDGCWTTNGGMKRYILNGKIVTVSRENELFKNVPNTENHGLQTSTPNRG